MLDLDATEISDPTHLPRGWHFVLMAADTRRSALRSDGFPGLGIPMPDLGFPRLMLAGRAVKFHQDIPIGCKVSRSSAITKIVAKNGASGEMRMVTLEHELSVADLAGPAIVETQTYFLLPARTESAVEVQPAGLEPVRAERTKTVVPDDTLLFQYSALCFNSHRIHLDRAHARDIEGFPDLVVNGGLATLLLTEFLRDDLGVRPTALKSRHILPLYSNRPVTLAADKTGTGWRIQALNDMNRLAVDMEVEIS
jgi:3-methylfumaryl-CoA hydratase